MWERLNFQKCNLGSHSFHDQCDEVSIYPELLYPLQTEGKLCLIAGGGEGGAEEESRVPRPEDHRLREPDPDLLDARQDLPLLRHLQGRRPRRQGRRRGGLEKGRMRAQDQMSALEMESCNFSAGSDE